MRNGASRILRLVAVAVIGMLLIYATKSALAARPGRLVAIESSGTTTCGALFAVDASGTIYFDCGYTGHFQVGGQVPGVPVTMARDISSAAIRIGMENGDVYVVNPLNGPPFAPTLLGNVFTP